MRLLSSRKFFQQRLRLFESRKQPLVRLELRRMHATPSAAVIPRDVKVQHFVGPNVLERQARDSGLIEDSTDHDHVVRRIEMPEPSARPYRAPANCRAGHHPPEIQPVDFFENVLKVVHRTLRTRVGLATPRLTHQTDLAPHILPVQIEAVSMYVLRGCGPAVQLTQQNMGEGFGHRSGRALEQIADANPYGATVKPDIAVGIREAFVLDFHSGYRRSR